MAEVEAVSLDLLDRRTVRVRARNVAIAALLVGAALGGIVGLFAGPVGFGVTFAVVAIPLLLLAFTEARKTVQLRGEQVVARALGSRVVDVRTATRLELFVTDLRGTRTINVLVGGRGKAISVALAMYAGTGGRELGIYGLRRLADALATNPDTRALVLSQLIVAQLRAEARGEPAPNRPLYQLGSQAPQGGVAKRLNSDAVARFVATL
jgi:hypothetical protein